MSRRAWILSALVAILAIGSLVQGYFEDWALHVMAAALFTVAAVTFFTSPITSFRSFHLALLLFVLVYGLSTLHAVDQERSLIEVMRVSVYLPFGFLLLLLDSDSGQKLQLYLTRIAVAVVVVGMMFGMERNGRLESTIEYANALAIMLLVALCISLKNYVQNGKRIELAVSALLVAGLLLTMSRSVWVLWFLSAIAVILLFPSFRRKENLLAIGVTHVAGWLIAVAYKGNFLFLLDRARTIEPGASEFQWRLVYLKDGWRMFHDYWLLGAGGGGWRLLQSQYQSERQYYVKFIHNHYMQLSLDAGILGLIAFVLFIIIFYVSLRRLMKEGNSDQREEWKWAGLVVALMLLHAGFDFDLTFPLLAAMLLIFMSGVITVRSASVLKISKKLKYALPALFLALFLASSWLAIGYVQQHYATALREQGQLNAAEPHYKIASSMIPWSHTTHYEWAKLYVIMGNQSQDQTRYQQAYREISKAIDLQPAEPLYLELREDLEKNMKVHRQILPLFD